MVAPSEEQIRYTKYKWEFLRRNREYKEDWEHLRVELENKYGIPLEKLRWAGLDYVKEFEEIDANMDSTTSFCKKWNVSAPLCPYIDYENYIDMPGAEGEMFWCVCPIEGLPVKELREVPRGYNLRSHLKNEFVETGKIIAEINLNYSRRRLIEEFELFLDDWFGLYEREKLHKIYKKNLAEKDLSPSLRVDQLDEDTIQEIRRIYGEDLAKREAKYIPKFHWDNLNLYLKVYDLKIEGKSYSQIAKILKLNSKDTARNHYRSAITLIKDGIELYGISEG
jgi:hypothetical protein